MSDRTRETVTRTERTVQTTRPVETEPVTTEAVETEARPRRGGKGWVIALIILALLVGGLIFADRYARVWGQDKAAANLQQQMGTPERPKVVIDDLPFLTSAASSTFKNVSVTADRLQTRVPIEHIDAKLKDVKMSDNYTKGVAKEINGKARLTWQAVSKEAGFDLKFAGENKVQTNYEVDFLGQKLNALVMTEPRLDVEKQTVVLDKPTVNVAGITLPTDLTKQIIDTFVKPITLPLPAGIKATTMNFAEDGVNVDFEGRDVDLTQLK